MRSAERLSSVRRDQGRYRGAAVVVRPVHYGSRRSAPVRGGPSPDPAWSRLTEAGVAPSGRRGGQPAGWERPGRQRRGGAQHLRTHDPAARRPLGVLCQLVAEATATEVPALRHGWLTVPGTAAADVDPQFFFGSAILVAPVVTEGASRVEVTLPPGPIGIPGSIRRGLEPWESTPVRPQRDRLAHLAQKSTLGPGSVDHIAQTARWSRLTCGTNAVQAQATAAKVSRRDRPPPPSPAPRQG